MKDVWKEPQPNLGFKQVNKKKIIITLIVAVIVVLLIILVGTYYSSKPVREWIDKNIFR